MDRLEKTHAVVEAAQKLMAEDVVALDVHEVSSFTDVFVIATGRSDRQVRAIADAVAEALAAYGEKPLGVEGYADGRWVLIDLADVVVHVFHAELRAVYDLERLWSDGARIELASAGSRSAS